MYKLFISLLFIISFNLHATVQWKFNSQGLITGKPVVHQNSIYLLSGQSLKVLNKKGKLQWHYDLHASTYSEVLIDQQTIYLLADNGLHAIDLSGNKLWHFTSQDHAWQINGKTWGWGDKKVDDIWAWYRSSPIISNNKVIFANANGTFAVDKITGKQLWHTNTGVTHTKPAIENNIVVVGSWNNKLYGINSETGEILWQFTARIPQGTMASWDGWFGFNLSPLIYKNTVYVGSRGSYFYAIDVDEGTELWSSQYAATWIGSPAIEQQGKIYFGTSDGYSLIGLDANKGAQTLLYLNDFYNFAQPQTNENHIYFGSVSGQIYAINNQTSQGEKIFSTPESIENYSALVKEEGGLKTLYSTGDNYNYENSTKDTLRMLTKLNAILSMSLVDDVLYVGTANGTLYALTL